MTDYATRFRVAAYWGIMPTGGAPTALPREHYLARSGQNPKAETLCQRHEIMAVLQYPWVADINPLKEDIREYG